jgi:RimK-like ATP-grasp domain
MKIVVYPYNMVSESAKALANALNCKRVYPNKRYKPKRNDLIINWGNSTYAQWDDMFRKGKLINAPIFVKIASNKLLSYSKFKHYDIPHPEWTRFWPKTAEWIDSNKGHKICGFARLTLNGHSGEGMIPFYHDCDPNLFPTHGLVYTKYIPKRKEFRVHVFKGAVIDVQQKLKSRDFTGERSNTVRNHATGWLFCREGIIEPDELRGLAMGAVRALGLDFGAVDIIWNERQNKCYVLEVNTAPGLEGTTLNKYVEIISKYKEEHV